ncbi:TPA: hypothetical protein ACGVAU_004243 [Vibrio vulnificus]|uniref:MarR family transcriptional regulator n=5 Tax=Vibrio TaxID=662 RepID=A0ABY5ILA6_9VIBR|nr:MULTISPECIES: hypothetical protein [Vibrio]ABX77077.1 hypothetical protein BMSC_0014 [Vibrio sp. 0908]EKO3597339.1 hypothetical protein [Vibrio metschnikovii]EKQ3696135.1 hypothetical protein [Vibrio vulnificus]NAW55469.1 hypothetical protein [Vibrio sp. V41_P2S12T139]NAW93449.1 hypothetical protein [Vibrio sp. V42_P2S4T144]
MLKNAEVRVLVILKKEKKNTIAMTDLTRRLNVNAGIKAAEKNQILESLKEQGLVAVERKQIPAMRRTPTLITLTEKGKQVLKGIESGDIEFET